MQKNYKLQNYKLQNMQKKYYTLREGKVHNISRLYPILVDCSVCPLCIKDPQVVSYSQLCHQVANLLNRSQSKSESKSLSL